MNLFRCALIGCSLLLFALSANAENAWDVQEYGPYGSQNARPQGKGMGKRLVKMKSPQALSSDHFAVVDDRWRIVLPDWYRYDLSPGLWDPYHQNVLKGDFPIINDNIFFIFTGISDTVFNAREKPIGGGINRQENVINQNFFLSFELFQGKTVFKPKDWSAKIAPAFNLNYLDVRADELEGDGALQEGFLEVKLCDVNEFYDTVSLRAGRQAFVSDFRGFIFNDVNQGGQLFGQAKSNRLFWNIAAFDQREKDPTSNFNLFDAREQYVFIGTLAYQDFIWPGYNSEVSFHYNRDRKGEDLDTYYLGFAGDGHIGRINVAPAFYYVWGKQDNNAIAGQNIDVKAYFAALELSYPHDFLDFRFAIAFASGDDDANDSEGNGFDAIFDNPNFAGNGFSYWVREGIAVNGQTLTNGNSFLPNLRGKAGAQANHVNPGIFIMNWGVDAKLTPKTFLTTNLNYFEFVQTSALQKVFGAGVEHSIGWEIGAAIQHRPLLSENIILTGSFSTLFPQNGLEQITGTGDEVYTAFIAITLVY